jgi:hypothetical protein
MRNCTDSSFQLDDFQQKLTSHLVALRHSKRIRKMKKLIFAAAAVAGMGAFALESANVVGYNGATSGSENNFITIPFSDIGYNTADIQAIKISDNGSVGFGTEMFSVWEGVPTVAAGSEFVYFSPIMDPTGTATDFYWGDASGNKVNYSIAPGKGFVINCAADLTVTIDAPFDL